MSLNAQLIETKEGLPAVVDQYGDVWDVYVDDGAGNYAIQRDGGERWLAAIFAKRLGTIYEQQEGDTFGVNCRDEFVVERTDSACSLSWTENTATA